MGSYLGLAGNWRNRADLAALERVDHRALSDVRVSHKTDRYLLLVRMQLGELAQKLDKSAFAERVVRGGVESNRRVSRCQVLNVASLFEV